MARKKKQEDDIDTGAWLNTYADMVTLLLTFFVMLLATSSTNPEILQAISSYFNPTISFLNSGETIGEGKMVGSGLNQMPNYDQALEETSSDAEKEVIEKNQQMASDFKTYFEENNLTSKVEVTTQDNFTTINFKDDVLFDKSQAILKPEARNILDMLSGQFMKYPNTDIKVEGHADSDKINTAQYPSNWYLSSARAIVVAEYYINEKGFSPDRMSATGYGEYRPITSNDTKEGKAKNRRVEIKIYQRSNS